MPWCRTSTLFLAIRRPCCSIEGIDRLNQANEPRLTRRCREILNDETSSVKMSPFPRQAKGWKPGITYVALTVFAQFPRYCWTAQSTQLRFCCSLVAACMQYSSSLSDGTLSWVWFHNSKPIMEMGNFYVGCFNLAYMASVGQTVLAFSLFLFFSFLRGSCRIHSDYYSFGASDT